MKWTDRDERRMEWTVALCAAMTAAVCVALGIAAVASVFFGWGCAV